MDTKEGRAACAGAWCPGPPAQPGRRGLASSASSLGEGGQAVVVSL